MMKMYDDSTQVNYVFGFSHVLEISDCINTK